MALHIHNKAPSQQTLKSCARLITPDSEILLIQDAVLSVLQAELLKPLLDYSIYALAQDCEARGIPDKQLKAVTLIDMSGFVELTERHSTIQNW